MRKGRFLMMLSMVAVCSTARAEMIPLPVQALSEELQARVARLNAAQLQTFNAQPNTQSDRLAEAKEADDIRKAIAEELIGKGYDLWSGTLFSKCITPREITPRPVPSNGHNPHNVYNVRQIENVSQYSEDRSSGLNASLTYKLISFGGSTSEYSGQSFLSTSKYLDIYIRYVGDEYAASQGAPTDIARAAIDAGNERFAKLCGQQFISRVGFGVTLDARLNAQVDIDASSKANKSEVSIGFKNLISLGADSAGTIQKLNQHATLSAVFAGNGGLQPKPEELIEYARRFGENNPAATSNQEIYIETTPYSEVAYRKFAGFDDVAMIATGTVLDLADDRLAILQQRADLNLAIDNADYFEINGAPKTAADLTALRDVQSTYLDKLGKLWAICRVALDKETIEKCVKAVPQSGDRPERLRITLAKQTP